MYELRHEDNLPNFLPHVKLDPHGGLSRLEDVLNNQKYFWCLVAHLSVIFNVFFLLNINWSVLLSFRQEYWVTALKHHQSIDVDAVMRSSEAEQERYSYNRDAF